MNDFATDLEYSLKERDNELFDSFYSEAFPGLESIEFVDDIETQKMGIDKILQFENGRRLTVDEKKRRDVYDDVLLEIWSIWSDQKKKLGWLFTTQCDLIVYAKITVGVVYLLPVDLLRMAWRTNRSKWWKYKRVEAKNNGYVTISRAIPDKELLQAIKAEMQQPFTSHLSKSLESPTPA